VIFIAISAFPYRSVALSGHLRDMPYLRIEIGGQKATAWPRPFYFTGSKARSEQTAKVRLRGTNPEYSAVSLTTDRVSV